MGKSVGWDEPVVEEEEEGDLGLWECKDASINVNGLLAKGVHKKTDSEGGGHRCSSPPRN